MASPRVPRARRLLICSRPSRGVLSNATARMVAHLAISTGWKRKPIPGTREPSFRAIHFDAKQQCADQE